MNTDQDSIDILKTMIKSTFEKSNMNEEHKKVAEESVLKTIIESIIELEKEKIIEETKLQKKNLIEEGEKEKAKLIKEGKNGARKSELLQAIEKTKNILYEGILIAFIIGIVVNQITELIGSFKQIMFGSILDKIFIIATIIIVIVSFIGLELIIRMCYFSKIQSLFSGYNRED